MADKLEDLNFDDKTQTQGTNRLKSFQRGQNINTNWQNATTVRESSTRNPNKKPIDKLNLSLDEIIRWEKMNLQQGFRNQSSQFEEPRGQQRSKPMINKMKMSLDDIKHETRNERLQSSFAGTTNCRAEISQQNGRPMSNSFAYWSAGRAEATWQTGRPMSKSNVPYKGRMQPATYPTAHRAYYRDAAEARINIPSTNQHQNYDEAGTLHQRKMHEAHRNVCNMVQTQRASPSLTQEHDKDTLETKAEPSTGLEDVFCESMKLLVTNLSSGVTDAILCKHFEQFGSLWSCNVRYDKDGKSLRFAVVDFEAEESVFKALKEANGSLLHEKPMKITLLSTPEGSLSESSIDEQERATKDKEITKSMGKREKDAERERDKGIDENEQPRKKEKKNEQTESAEEKDTQKKGENSKKENDQNEKIEQQNPTNDTENTASASSGFVSTIRSF